MQQNKRAENFAKSEYYHSKERLTNLESGRPAALRRHQELKQERIANYARNPRLCKQCSNLLPYACASVKNFCNRSCSGTYNGKLRKHTEASKNKLRGKNWASSKPPVERNKVCLVSFKSCPVCAAIFYVRGAAKWGRKTCTRRCQTIASTSIRPYQNGSRKNTYYKNPFNGKTILLESSWEVKIADLLGQQNIIWDRPKPIGWVDNQGKNRLYYADFYLPNYGLYLDPKNPYCMEIGKEKMEKVSLLVDIRYGSLEYIIDVVMGLVRVENFAISAPRFQNAYSTSELHPDK